MKHKRCKMFGDDALFGQFIFKLTICAAISFISIERIPQLFAYSLAVNTNKICCQFIGYFALAS